MKQLPGVASIVVIVLGLAAHDPATAGPYADDMAKCLVKSATSADRSTFMKFLFAALSLHPDVASLANVSAAQRDGITQDTGALLQRLLTEDCRAETTQAIQNEGPQTVDYAFQIFGQVIGRGLFGDPHVAEGMKGLSASLDVEKLKALSASATPK